MDTIHKTEYRIRDLPTRSVTLFPTRAQIVRDIKDVALKPGSNEITILGMTPSVDEDSIKVEGTGSAIISDIAVELLPNRDIFEDIYPDSDSDDHELDSDDEDEEDDSYKDSAALTTVRDKLTLLRDDQKRAKEVVSNAESRLKILDAYGKMLDRKRGVDIDAGLEMYRQEREKVFQYHMDGVIQERELVKQIDELTKEETRLENLKFKEMTKAEKAKAKVRKIKEKEREKIRRRKAERIKEKARIRKEREAFWPRYCWSIRIILDATTFTPSSSRRSSIASSSDLVKVVPEPATPDGSSAAATSLTCDLSLCYVTSSAWWSPSYDLALTTTSNTALLCFDAQLTNKTSENWTNCKVVLSTSQTTFSGLQDALPTLVPWRLRLGARHYGAKSDILDSREERTEKGEYQAQQNAWGAQKSRNHLFGLRDSDGIAPLAKPNALPAPPLPAQSKEGASHGFPRPLAQQDMFQAQAQASSTAFGQAAPGGTDLLGARGRGGAFGGITNLPATLGGTSFASNSLAVPARAAASSMVSTERKKSKKSSSGFFRRTSGVFGGRAEESDGFAPDAESYSAVLAEDEAEDDGDTMLDRNPELSFQESSFEETGMTTTYDLPGLKTLNTSSTASKQRVARITFANVTFSHTIVAKYKPVAYLKTKVRNASKLTLLKGPVGLTLDGSFMGRSTLPRCSAGDSFTMSLGVDPAIGVTYPKPDVKRSTTGLFTKEDSSVYTRTVTISNTRATAGKAVNLVVLDQVPVSEDDRLRIEILQPRGMTISSATGVSAGVPGKEGKDNLDWGKATATLKKAGEVSWDVVLNAGRSVKLALEYEVALPAGDHAVQC